jgi:hypothetical protein
MSPEDEEFDHLNSTVYFGRGAEKSPNRDNVTLEFILHRLEALEANIHAKTLYSVICRRNIVLYDHQLIRLFYPLI